MSHKLAAIASFISCFNPMDEPGIEVEHLYDINEVFRQYSKNSEKMDREQFCEFLLEYQEENDTHVPEITKKLFDRNTQELDFKDFCRYLYGADNPPLKEEVQYQDMEATFADYFIYTRVKTQLFKLHKGKLASRKLTQSVASITEALKKGVRVIQLELSSASNKNGSNINYEEPVISKAINDCLQKIGENAFTDSDHPVIIIFEGNLESKLKSLLVQKAELMLPGQFYNPKDDDWQKLVPNALKRKILIPQLQDEPHEQKIESIEFNPEKLKDKLTDMISTGSAWCRMTHLDLEKATKRHGNQLVEYTRRNLLTVDPKHKVTGYSNFNPLNGWTHGAQMVAVNTQGYDKYLWVTQGMFRANGKCGYVKKPDILLKGSSKDREAFDPSPTVKTTLKVKVYMGDGWRLDFSRMYFDVTSAPDFFIKVQILGNPNDGAKEEIEVQRDDWTPIWNQEFVFKIEFLELAMLRIEVRELDDEKSFAFGGQTCLPVWELNKGIRAVPLYDKRGDPYKHVRLLMRFQFQFEDKS